MKTPDLFFEQILLAEKDVQDFSLSEESVADSINTLKKSNEEILKAYPANSIKTEILNKMNDGTHRQPEQAAKQKLKFPHLSPVHIGSVAALFCSVIFISMLTLRISPETSRAETAMAGERIKGNGAKLFIYKQEGLNTIRLEANTTVAKNDLLQISYIAGGYNYGAIISLDGNGVVTQHFPENGNISANLSTNGEVPLDFSYKLDDAPIFERFIFIAGKEKFSTASVKKAIQALSHYEPLTSLQQAASLPADTQITDLLLLK